MGFKIPKHIIGPDPKTPKEFEAQNKRISDWLIKNAAEDAAKKFEEGQK